MSTDPNHAKSIFLNAAERPVGEARDAYLAEACGGDPVLRREVDELLAHYEQVGAFLETPSLVPTIDSPPAERAGTLIGSYKLVEEIGEGGMGTVYLAQQQEPVKRLVALKVIKSGMDSKQVLARFEAERQALALMDHPNIARVFDGGMTQTGRPYFVMELVKGTPITRYCDDHRLTPRERLELFVQVCQAVQHAHTKGVIHRDLKPNNVLVAPYDGKPVVKVIDFGVAKAAGPSLTDRTLVTGVGAVVGTPEYMSPEQAELNNRDIDTRSDIYSLGILLYELLTGSTPLTSKRVKEAALLEMLRVIREEEPPRPSTRLSTTEELPSIAANRGLEPKRLSGLVRGELDWIVLKALEKDRDRRYETAGTFAADVQRYLADEPVQAWPPSVGYRLRKLVQRNKGPVVAASLVVLALVGGIVGTTVGLVQAEQARQAEARRAEGERRAKETAEKRLAQIEKGIDLLGSIFENLDPHAEEKEGRPLRAILADRLGQAAAQLEGEAVGDPLVVARLQDRLGMTYLGLGHAAEAEVLFTKALATRKARLGTDHPDTLGSMNSQALAYEAAGKLPQAVERFEQLRDVQVRKLGPEDPDTLTTCNHLGVAYRLAKRPAEAVALLEQVGEARAKQLGADHPDTLTTLHCLAAAYRADGKLPEAIALHERVREARLKRLGPDHPDTLRTLHHLALAYRHAHRMADAIAMHEQLRDTQVKRLGPDHPQTLTALNNLGETYRLAWKPNEAIALFEQVRDARLRKLEADYQDAFDTLDNLAEAYAMAGEMEKALRLYQQAALTLEKRKFVHPRADQIVRNLSACLEHLKQYDRAEVWLRKWLAAVRDEAGLESAAYAAVLAALGANLLKQAKYADAQPVLLRGYEGMKKREVEIPPQGRLRLTEALEGLVQLYDAWGKPDEAAKWGKELEAARAAARAEEPKSP